MDFPHFQIIPFLETIRQNVWLLCHHQNEFRTDISELLCGFDCKTNVASRVDKQTSQVRELSNVCVTLFGCAHLILYIFCVPHSSNYNFFIAKTPTNTR